MELLKLPHELLAVICSQLDYTDIHNIRKTCKVLRRISHNRDVWVGVFWNFMKREKMPQPFFGLPKPLPECSSEDLERCIVRWEADWPTTISANVSRIPIETSVDFGSIQPDSSAQGSHTTFWCFGVDGHGLVYFRHRFYFDVIDREPGLSLRGVPHCHLFILLPG
ncbi:hypothetical protein FA13DRAFT_829205 [Coprinellus micaceus]|uniref:F-box domain-containing protein n=1 Tax=Coprinellus micaceus TaxID=71717 RepID=A0A4Y7T282_COPMI|nr:hypothetical protein FA13DRAFT_829205 [Coprinellus micaceus]